VTDLSIVIVSFNARADLTRCLSSLHQAPPAISHEIIVVDNASTDGSAQAAREWRQVRVIESPTNRGFAAANNAGIRQSTGRALLLLNPDTIVPAGAIDRLLAELDRQPDAAAIGPRLVDGSGQAELSFGSMISPMSELRQRRLMRGLERGDPAIRREVDAMTRQDRSPDWVSGACLLVRRRDAEAVGLLDERYAMYTEDVDFCAALRAQGRRVLFTPAVEVVHLRGRSAATAPDATRAAYRRSHLAFYRKHHPALAPFLRLYQWLRPL
jgi:N-acetylglucosaminyl-diphospho-decaprenol L-rhamnosyltransferase